MVRVFQPQRRNGEGSRTTYRCWYVDFQDSSGVRRRLRAFADKKASVELGRRLSALAARLSDLDLIDGGRVAARKSLDEHVRDLEQAMRDAGRSAVHILKTTHRVKRVMDACAFRALADLDAGKAKAAIAQFVQQGMSLATANHHVTALKMFAAWCVREGRLGANPLAGLQKWNAATDRRVVRRALTEDEQRRLLSVAETGPDVFGVCGAERALLYRLALESGLRANELRALVRSSFDFESSAHSVTVSAKDAKNRRADTLPLRPATAEPLRRALADRTPNAPAFRVPDRTAEMLAADLERAGIPRIDEAGRVVDFHSLRHTFITNLARGGVHPRVAQRLARHSTVELTMNRYTHVSVEQEADAIARLPDLSPSSAETSQRATGTFGAPTPTAIGERPPAPVKAVSSATGDPHGSTASRRAPTLQRRRKAFRGGFRERRAERWQSVGIFLPQRCHQCCLLGRIPGDFDGPERTE